MTTGLLFVFLLLTLCALPFIALWKGRMSPLPQKIENLSSSWTISNGNIVESERQVRITVRDGGYVTGVFFGKRVELRSNPGEGTKELIIRQGEGSE